MAAKSVLKGGAKLTGKAVNSAPIPKGRPVRGRPATPKAPRPKKQPPITSGRPARGRPATPKPRRTPPPPSSPYGNNIPTTGPNYSNLPPPPGSAPRGRPTGGIYGPPPKTPKLFGGHGKKVAGAVAGGLMVGGAIKNRTGNAVDPTTGLPKGMYGY